MKVRMLFCAALAVELAAVCPVAVAAEPTPTPTPAAAEPESAPPAAEPSPAPTATDQGGTPMALKRSTRFGASGGLGSPGQLTPSGQPRSVVISNENLAGLAGKGRISEGTMSSMDVAPKPGAAASRSGAAPASAQPVEDKNEARDELRKRALDQKGRVDSLERDLAQVDRDVEVLQKSSNENSRRSLAQALNRQGLARERLAAAREELRQLELRSRE